MQVIFYISLNSSFAFAKHHSSSLLAVKASPSPEGRDLGWGERELMRVGKSPSNVR